MGMVIKYTYVYTNMLFLNLDIIDETEQLYIPFNPNKLWAAMAVGLSIMDET